MICTPTDQIYKWVRADGGWDLGSIVFANGLVVTTEGLLKFEHLQPDDRVQVQTACDGPMWFVEFGRLKEMDKRED